MTLSKTINNSYGAVRSIFSCMSAQSSARRMRAEKMRVERDMVCLLNIELKFETQ